MLEEKLKNLPESPGVYLMHDEKGAVIYIGKAVNLRNRVRSYFLSLHSDAPRTRALVKRIHDLEYILTDNEIEALILESNLIKKHRPKYNVRLTDDKNYPYIKVTLSEKFPRLEIARTRKNDGSRYFGPYTETKAVNDTLRLLKKIFPLRSCKQAVLVKRERPCLNAHIGRCSAPCSGEISAEDYQKLIVQVLLFLEGRQEELQKQIQTRMEQAARELDFEQAAKLRDKLQAICKIISRQKIVSGKNADLDVIHVARGLSLACAQVFFIRGGNLLGRACLFMEGTEEMPDGEILTAFIKQYYSQAEYTPAEILLPDTPDDEAVLKSWLAARRGSQVRLRVPKAGEKLALMEMVKRNAEENLKIEMETKAATENRRNEALEQLSKLLSLSEKPLRMECYDISHIQGTETVAAMVVFEHGRPCPSKYRRFKIRTVTGTDDFASMSEVISRRFKRAGLDEKFAELPGLIVIDGGKGQLSAAYAALKAFGYENIPVIGLAKENEWVYKLDSSEPLILSRSSSALQLLQRIRDEAHRFAISYHRLLRGKRNLASALDEIAGIGPKRKKALLEHFGMSLQKIRAAKQEEIAAVKGIGHEAAQNVWEYFNPADLDHEE